VACSIFKTAGRTIATVDPLKVATRVRMPLGLLRFVVGRFVGFDRKVGYLLVKVGHHYKAIIREDRFQRHGGLSGSDVGDSSEGVSARSSWTPDSGSAPVSVPPRASSFSPLAPPHFGTGWPNGRQWPRHGCRLRADTSWRRSHLSVSTGHEFRQTRTTRTDKGEASVAHVVQPQLRLPGGLPGLGPVPLWRVVMLAPVGPLNAQLLGPSSTKRFRWSMR
jgi:hypothetical protein